MQKFNIGDRVRVIKYGHRIWEREDENLNVVKVIDLAPELVGQIGMVEGSYADLSEKNNWGSPRNHNSEKSYTLSGIKGKTAWYDESQLELVEDGKV